MAFAPAIPPTSLNYKSMSASALVKTGAGVVFKITVASSSSGTIKLWDNTSAAGTVMLDTMSVYAGEQYELSWGFTTGLYITLGGTVNITVDFI
jgi:hypothetical protein